MMIPMILFWVLVLLGRNILGWKGSIFCIFLWLAFGIIFYSLGLSPYYFIGFQALFDIILVLVIFGGDLTIR